MSRKVEVYSDGACKGNPGKGGWGAVMIEERFEWKQKGGEDYTTNNAMELTGALMALRMIPPDCEATLVSDSEYFVKGMAKEREEEIKHSRMSFRPIFTGNLNFWMENNWTLKSTGKRVANQNLWKEIVKECERVFRDKSTLKIRWTKGHDGSYGNELADRLANEGVPQ